MPLYAYKCDACGRVLEERRAVDSRDLPASHDCGGVLLRVFDPASVTLTIPTHFALKHLCAGWHLPRKEDGKVDYTNLCRPDEIRSKPDVDDGCEGLAEYLKGELLGKREKITLSSGGTGG